MSMLFEGLLADVLDFDDPGLGDDYWEFSLVGSGMGLLAIYSLHFNNP